MKSVNEMSLQEIEDVVSRLHEMLRLELSIEEPSKNRFGNWHVKVVFANEFVNSDNFIDVRWEGSRSPNSGEEGKLNAARRALINFLMEFGLLGNNDEVLLDEEDGYGH